MTALDDPLFEAWLARWREVSAGCWARKGWCCGRAGCAVELLGGPPRPESGSEIAAEPYPSTDTSGSREDRIGDVSRLPGPIRADSTTTERSQAA